MTFLHGSRQDYTLPCLSGKVSLHKPGNFKRAHDQNYYRRHLHLSVRCTMWVLTHRNFYTCLGWRAYKTPAPGYPLSFPCGWPALTQSTNWAKLGSEVTIFNLTICCYGGRCWFVKALMQSIVDRKLLDTPFPSLGRSTPPETRGFSSNFRSFCRDSFLVAAMWLT
jgi:hypothetical protein